MRKITITDLAKEANVSLGTVSNVLNNRGNVKVETIRKVETAAKKFNYTRSSTALSIRQKSSNKIALILPKLNDDTMDLYMNLYHEIENKQLTLTLFETQNDAEIEQSCYSQIEQDNYYAIFILNNLSSEENIRAWLKKSKNIIFIGAMPEQKKDLNLDLRPLLSKDTNQTFVIKDELGFGFYKCFPTKNIIDNAMNKIYQQMQTNPTATFITFNNKVANRIKNMAQTLGMKQLKIKLLTAKNIVSFQTDNQETIFHYSANKLALSLIGQLDSTKTDTIKIYQTNYQTFSYTKKDISLNILLLETPFSRILQNLIPDFTAKYNIDINIETKNFTEMRRALKTDIQNQYDLIRLDISDFNWFGHKLFQPLDKIPELQTELTQLANWQQYIYLNQTAFALPLDPSVQMMLFQTKIFNNAILQKQYSEEFGRELTPPKTYPELIDFAQFMSSSDDPEKDIYPLSLISETDILIASEFLPYYYSLGGKVFFEDGILKFDSTIFLKTFKMYQQLRKFSQTNDGNWWNSETNAFNNQESALLIGFSNHLNDIDPTKYGVAPIPGNKPALGGGLIGISSETKHQSESILFLKWLYQYQIQHEIALMGGDVPANNLFFEREIYEQFPFLSDSIDLYQTGIRKTTVNHDFNLYTLSFEKILGHEIKMGIQQQLDPTTVLLNINNSLLKNISNLIKPIKN